MIIFHSREESILQGVPTDISLPDVQAPDGLLYTTAGTATYHHIIPVFGLDPKMINCKYLVDL